MCFTSRVFIFLTAFHLTAPAFLGAAQSPDQVPSAPVTTEAARANNEFGWNVFEEIRGAQRKEDNMLFSPLSAWLALSLASNGAEQETLQEIQTVLRTNQYSLVQTNPLVRDLIRSLVTSERSTEVLRIANGVWVNSDSFELAEKFQTDAQTFYSILPDDEVVTSESFSDVSTLQHINNWVSKNTGGMIPSILNELDPDMASILLNALYFQAQWLQPFSPLLTGNDSFQLADGSSKTVAMMRNSHLEVPFVTNGVYKMISLAFRKGTMANGEGEVGRFVLDVVLPEKANRSIFAFERNDYQSLLQDMQPGIVRVAIPKFQFSFEESLTAALQAIGMERAFRPGQAQLAPLGIPKGEGTAYISDVLQKTAVEVDENGFKAAAVTAVIVGTTAEPRPTAEFIANRPFFIALRDRVTGALLFQGIIANPE
jgi:serine protease inhibitor